MKTYIIKCGKLYDGKTDVLQDKMEILVEDNRIKEVDKHVAAPAGAEVIDLSDATVTPGLIDAHVHFSFGDWRTRSHDAIYEAPIYKGMYALYNAKKSMLRGFTTIRHCGCNCDDGYSVVVAKRLLNDGHFVGSRIVQAPHYVSTTRGHGDFSQLIMTNPKLSTHIWENYPGFGSGPDMFREVVRRQVKYGADFIKMFASGGFNSEADGPEDYTFTDEEMQAIIEVSHQMHMKVASHTYSPELAYKQIGMGIDDIEHGALFNDPKLLDLMKQKGVHFVPTFTPYESVIKLDEDNLRKQTPGMQRKLRKYQEWLMDARKVIVNSDIPLGYGTDFVAVHNPYEGGWEYNSMLTSGVDPFRALAAATRVNADILSMPNDIGAIAPGYYADIAAWKRDLLSDPHALLDCYFVMKDGVVYKTEQDI